MKSTGCFWDQNNFQSMIWYRWSLAFSSRWTTSWVGSLKQSSAAIQMQSQRTGSLMTPARAPCPRCLYCGIHLHLIHLDPAPGLSSCQGGWRSEHLDRLLWQVQSQKSFLQYVAIFRNAADKEELEGRISYYPPSRAIPFSYFPYLVNMIKEGLTQSFSFSIRARRTKNTRMLDTTRHWLQSRWK